MKMYDGISFLFKSIGNFWTIWVLRWAEKNLILREWGEGGFKINIEDKLRLQAKVSKGFCAYCLALVSIFIWSSRFLKTYLQLPNANRDTLSDWCTTSAQPPLLSIVSEHGTTSVSTKTTESWPFMKATANKKNSLHKDAQQCPAITYERKKDCLSFFVGRLLDKAGRSALVEQVEVSGSWYKKSWSISFGTEVSSSRAGRSALARKWQAGKLADRPIRVCGWRSSKQLADAIFYHGDKQMPQCTRCAAAQTRGSDLQLKARQALAFCTTFWLQLLFFSARSASCVRFLMTTRCRKARK